MLIPFELLHPLGRFIEKRLMAGSKRVLVINGGLREYAIKIGANSANVFVLTAGIDSSRFNSSIDPMPVREKYGFSKNDRILFFMGWLYEFSGLREIIVRYSEMKSDVPNLKILIVGEGENYGQLKNLVNMNGLSDKIILTGWRPYDEIPGLIASSDLCLLPSRQHKIMNDVVPIKMFEYLAMGKPVISTKLPGILKEFGDNNGVLYCDSPEDALNVALRLNENEIEQNKAKALSFIKDYEWEEIVTRFEKILML